MKLHEKGIAYGDLRPGNIIGDDKGNFKLADQGVHKLVIDKEIHADTVIEALRYSSIDVLKGKKYNTSADIWSLGCILHELCCLEPAFTATNKKELIKKLEKQKYSSKAITKRYSPELKELIAAMLNPDEKKRPNCTTLLKNALIANSSKECVAYIIENSAGEKYIGQMKDNLRHGSGVMYYASGDAYKGEFRNGKRHGTGTFLSRAGEKYEGEWNNGTAQGKGVLIRVPGHKYIGEFVKGKRHGKGKECYPDGNRYEGEFENDEPNGKGVIYMVNGCIYEGMIKNGIATGKGILHHPDGFRYEGDFENSIAHGKGIEYNPNGNKYEGEWKNGMKNGKGILYYPDGTKREQNWREDKLISE